MNTLSIDFQPFVEWDNSPFILFDERKKIVYLNSAAEILLGYVSRSELSNLALSYAPQTFGYKTTMIDLKYDAFNFYAITVGYEDDIHISIRFYHAPRIKSSAPIDTDRLIMTDINMLLEAGIALFRTKNSNPLQLLTDQEIPSFKIDQNSFSKLLRKLFDTFIDADFVHVTLKLLIGEHMIIAGKKESVVQLSIEANERCSTSDSVLEQIADQSHVSLMLHRESVKVDIPLISAMAEPN
jgi:hypothetical protein